MHSRHGQWGLRPLSSFAEASADVVCARYPPCNMRSLPWSAIRAPGQARHICQLSGTYCAHLCMCSIVLCHGLVCVEVVHSGGSWGVAGRNIHALDPYRMPSQAALERGSAVAKDILDGHREANGGAWPETVAVRCYC